MVSATSTGWPPWYSEFSRRPTSRVANGIASVIFVSMKPGATALMVMPFSPSFGASASVRPIMPAFVAA